MLLRETFEDSTDSHVICWVTGTAHISQAKVGHTLTLPCGLGCLVAVHIVHTGLVAEKFRRLSFYLVLTEGMKSKSYLQVARVPFLPVSTQQSVKPSSTILAATSTLGSLS